MQQSKQGSTDIIQINNKTSTQFFRLIGFEIIRDENLYLILLVFIVFNIKRGREDQAILQNLEFRVGYLPLIKMLMRSST